MTSGRGRARILAALRAHPPRVPALPPVWNRGDAAFGDLQPRYEAALQAAGGQARGAETGDGGATLTAGLARLAAELGATRLGTAIAGLPGADELPGCTVSNLADVRDPHQLIDIDLAIVPGQFAVAENGAVWVSGSDLRQQALCFSCEHLALVVPAAALVPDMHAAYGRLALAEAERRRAAFGVFISGPSKTADIEQALVLGAHGPRSLTVFLVGGGLRPSPPSDALPPPAT